MDTRNTSQPSIPTATAGMDHSEELLAEVDEPPDERKPQPTTWAPPKLQPHTSFNKADPRMYQRRESLLTRQLHSEAEQTDEEESNAVPSRALSTQSTWSNPSVASTAELTSDDGHSVASPAISPPLPPTTITSTIPITEKPLTKEPQILEQSDKLAETSSEKSVEAGLGRKRCISFACGNKDKKPPTSQPKQPEPKPQVAPTPASPPKRKCALTFVCPTRATVESRPPLERTSSSKRLTSPPPPERRPSKVDLKGHRGSDSTVTHASPKSVRKSPPIVTTAATPTAATNSSLPRRKMSNDSDASTEALRFHEFASSDDEPEAWVQESGCHRSRLTVSDTLKKENIIRKACEEVEEEVVEEEEEAEEEDEDEDEAEADEDEADEDEDDDIEGEEESDDGFRTDDEEGFAESDSEGEDSDEEWWRPGGYSTAATSIDHLDLLKDAKHVTSAPSSSVGSASSSHISPRTLLNKARNRTRAGAVPIQARSEPVDLPDSTDFVCGTLDEDRPMEQAFINHRKQLEAAKHKARPQDIDPTFPTSDPEMDEEDDEDLEDPEESEQENLMHGDLEELDGDNTLRRQSSKRGRSSSNLHRSPPPPIRYRSPAPAALKRVSTARSPPPMARRGTARSPPPAPSRRGTARSPPPRKLFGHSPKRNLSPAPNGRMTSPPNTRRASPSAKGAALNVPNVLAGRPVLTRPSSLPRGGGFTLGRFNGFHNRDRDDSQADATSGDLHKRGAIDIYKGLEKKRQRRNEKLWQKACAKAAAKGDKTYKVKPGKGAEKMRELGLELQRYRGKGEHILSM